MGRRYGQFWHTAKECPHSIREEKLKGKELPTVLVVVSNAVNGVPTPACEVSEHKLASSESALKRAPRRSVDKVSLFLENLC